MADARISAYRALGQETGCTAYNLGTGKGYSVLQVVDAFSKACGLATPYAIKARRVGDIAEYFAVPDLAFKDLGQECKI